MITYEEYAEIRDSKGLTDGKVAKMAGFGRSTFSDWKAGRSTPKMEKLQKIADVFEIDAHEFIGNLTTKKSVKVRDLQKERFDTELIKLFHNATPDAQTSVITLLKNSQKEGSASSKEA